MTQVNIRMPGHDSLITELDQIPRVGDQINALIDGDIVLARVTHITNLLVDGCSTQTVIIDTEPMEW